MISVNVFGTVDSPGILCVIAVICLEIYMLCSWLNTVNLFLAVTVENLQKWSL